jgi:hypothetical protein
VIKRLGASILVLGAALLSCARMNVRLPAGSCGDLSYWSLPATLVLHEHPSDTRTAEELQTQARINLIKRAAEAQCRAQSGQYPASLSALASPPPRVRAAVGRCVADTLLLADAWSQPIEYRVLASGGLLIRSSGPDLQLGTADDIGLPPPNSALRRAFEVETECHRE